MRYNYTRVHRRVHTFFAKRSLNLHIRRAWASILSALRIFWDAGQIAERVYSNFKPEYSDLPEQLAELASIIFTSQAANCLGPRLY
jgi:hypothetical protein